MKRLLLFAGFAVLFAAEILRVYFIMPFPGSQHADTIGFAYWLSTHIVLCRIAGLALIAYPLFYSLNYAGRWLKAGLLFLLALYAVIFFFFNFRFEADKMFYQPENKHFATSDSNKIDTNKLVIGVVVNGEAKAYPVQIIGYHHQVRDTIGNTPVMITYCTVCRTGRAYSPLVNGKMETFRLVGMDHFNAMFEDAATKSWWQQATGIAIAGPLKGTRLTEIPSQQSGLAAWLRQYPGSAILQPDTLFNKKYEDLADFDKGTIKGSLEKRDSASFKFKSWVIGVVHQQSAKAYDWNELVKTRMIQDSLPGLPLIIALEKDTASFHVWSRNVKGKTLLFVNNNQAGVLTDDDTKSNWNMNGTCIEGPLKGEQLQRVQAYQEFWHSWQYFHPQTKKFE